jgi:uncharacterized protein (TIGR03083 family)
VEVATHIEVLRVEGESMAAAAAAADPDTAVPTCPEWTVRDLVRHMGGVHRWATGYVADARTEVWDVELDDVVGAWPDDADLADWLRHGCDALATALAAAPPDLECWTFLPAPSPLAMWARRQVHETAIHRTDAELAAGTAVRRCTSAFAADGVDELLVCFVPRRSTRRRAEVPTTLVVRCRDVDDTWALHADGDRITTTPGESGGGAACTVTGKADDLYRALWNRAGVGDLVIEGDRELLGLFLEGMQVRWA